MAKRMAAAQYETLNLQLQNWEHEDRLFVTYSVEKYTRISGLLHY